MKRILKMSVFSECRKLDREDIYEWIYQDENKLIELQQENKKLENIERIFNQMTNLGVIEFDKEKNEVILVYDNAMEVIERQNKLLKEENKELQSKIKKLVDYYLNEMTRIAEKQKELKIMFGGNNRASDLLTGKLLMIISSGEILLEDVFVILKGN